MLLVMLWSNCSGADFTYLEPDKILQAARTCIDEARSLEPVSTACGMHNVIEEARGACLLLNASPDSLLSMSNQDIGLQITLLGNKLIKSIEAAEFGDGAYQARIDEVADGCWAVANALKRGLFSSHGALPDDSISEAQGLAYVQQLEYLIERAQQSLLPFESASPLPFLRSAAALEEHLISAKFIIGQFIENVFLPALREIVIPPDLDGPTVYLASNQAFLPLVPRLWNKLVFLRPYPSSDSPVMNQPVISSHHRMPSAVLDADQLYTEGAGVVILDDFLSVEALTELHQYLLESTIWHAPKIRYLGAYWHEGLHHPILMKLGRELRELYPFIGGNHSNVDSALLQVWAYNYNNFEQGAEGEGEGEGQQGIGLHVDSARVNVNIWITPDESYAGGDNGGGLVVYRKRALGTESFAQVQSEAFGREYLHGFTHDNVTVPYKCNRVVFFPSTLWHASDRSKFKQGWKNRRINLTLLFGRGPFADAFL